MGGTQTVALDAVIHATDIVWIAGQRLAQTLTDVAIARAPRDVDIAAAFADAWSIVDAVDRIRSMTRLLTRRVDVTLKPQIEEFDTATQAIRELRNLADHLPQRVEMVLSSNMPAIGRLSWVTVTSTRSAVVCVLDPSTLRTRRKSMSFPDMAGRQLVSPTSAVLLSAGRSEAWLDDATRAVYKLVDALEVFVSAYAQRAGLLGVEAGRDVAMFGELSFPEEMATIEDSHQLGLF
jgi:predicted nucleotidyltransferase